jgi:hypothetical protein
MKPWQAPLNKAPSKWEKRRTKRKDPSQNQDKQNPKWVIKGQRKKLCSKTLPIPPLIARSQSKNEREGNLNEE